MLAGPPGPSSSPPSDSSEKTRTVRPRPKSPSVIPLMPTHKTDSDGTIKKK